MEDDGRSFGRTINVSFPKKPNTIWNCATLVSPWPTAADQQSLLELNYCQKQNYAINWKKKVQFLIVF